MRAVDLGRRGGEPELLDIEQAHAGAIAACSRDLAWTTTYRVMRINKHVERA